MDFNESRVVMFASSGVVKSTTRADDSGECARLLPAPERLLRFVVDVERCIKLSDGTDCDRKAFFDEEDCLDSVCECAFCSDWPLTR